jgi:hypothetical protein
VKLLLLCFCVSYFFWIKTNIEVQLGDNYKYYKISSILRGILGEKYTTYTWKIELEINLRQGVNQWYRCCTARPKRYTFAGTDIVPLGE